MGKDAKWPPAPQVLTFITVSLLLQPALKSIGEGVVRKQW